MQSIAHIAPGAINGVADDGITGAVSQGVKNLFIVLQGSYGSLFLAKFATGVKDKATGRHDLGILAAMRTWDAVLSKFPASVIETAAARLADEHSDFPPNLPQFVRMCEAAAPRMGWAREQGLPALPAPTVRPVQVSLAERGDGKDWARRILARVEQGDGTVTRYSVMSARAALRLEARA